MILLFTASCGGGVQTLQGPEGDQMLRVQGNQIVDGKGQPVLLRGVAFGNQVWTDAALPKTHHAEVDYQRVAGMGMNAVRFYMNYVTFEDDDKPGVYKEAGWQWLDENVAWAKKHGIFLVLNMHVPPGGYQSGNKGKALWDDRSAQERLIKLWRAIAERYKTEPTIAGYDLLNEPVVSKSREQWHELAAELVPAVREVDPYHILFVERVNAVDGDWKEDEVRNFFLVDDPNVVYEFHFYKPFHFTHQGASWVEFAAEGTSYPDPNRVGIEWFLVHHKAFTGENPILKSGTTQWTYYEGAPFTVTDPEIVLGRPVMACKENSGKAYFDDLVLEQVVEGGEAKQLWTHNPDTDRGWYFDNPDGKGNYGLDRDGHEDRTSLMMERISKEGNLAADIHMFRVEQGATYRLSGWMKGDNVPEGAECRIGIDFLNADVPIHAWDKAFLEQELNTYLDFGRKHNVPLYLGEWGAIKGTFEDDRGGIRWVSDMLDLIEKYNLSFAYHDYHESFFGIYRGDSTLPDPGNANQPLIDLFTKRLVGK